jgi:hypothetical protein
MIFAEAGIRPGMWVLARPLPGRRDDDRGAAVR